MFEARPAMQASVPGASRAVSTGGTRVLTRSSPAGPVGR